MTQASRKLASCNLCWKRCLFVALFLHTGLLDPVSLYYKTSDKAINRYSTRQYEAKMSVSPKQQTLGSKLFQSSSYTQFPKERIFTRISLWYLSHFLCFIHSKFIIICFNCSLLTVFTDVSDEPGDCSVKYQKVGCYNENSGDRLLTKQVFSMRDEIDWTPGKWENFLKKQVFMLIFNWS